jgi:AcrR family transcriptional regulator
VQVAEIQRSRLLAGAVSAIEEHGYARATVTRITTCARVSRRTFYEVFDDREACLAALFDDVVALVEDELADAGLEDLVWRERVRGGLEAILGFLDREPALARMCVVQALSGGPRMLERREAILARLAGALDEGRELAARVGDCTPLTAEGLVGAGFAIVHARLSRNERKPLSALTNELMAMVVLPYQGPAAARREQARPAPKLASRVRRRPPVFAAGTPDPLQDIPMRLTYRTARVLQGIAQQPGASNRLAAEYAGIADQGQASKLLARLERLGLTVNVGEGRQKGEPNAWKLTGLGEQVAQRLHPRHADMRSAARSSQHTPTEGRAVAVVPSDSLEET